MGKQKKKIYIYLIATILLIGAASWYSYRNLRNTQAEHIHLQLQKRFIKKEAQLIQYTQTLSEDTACDVHSLLEFCRKHKINPGEFAFYVYRSGKLTAWSSNMVSLPSEIGVKTQNLNGFRRKESKSFYVRQQQKGERHIIAACLLESPLQQKNDLFNSQQEDVHTQKEANCYPIMDSEGNTAFYLNINDCVHEADHTAMLELLLWLSAVTVFLLLLNSLFKHIKFLRRHPNLTCLLLCTFALGMLHLCLCGHLPPALYTSKLFSSLYYSSTFKSLGGLLGGCYTLLLMAIVCAKKSRPGFVRVHSSLIFVNLSIVHLLYVFSFFAFYRMILNASMQVLPSLPLRDSLHTGQHIFALKFIFAFSLSSVICAVQILLEKCYAYSQAFMANKKNFIRISLASALLILIAYLVFVFCCTDINQHLFWMIGAIVYIGIISINIIHSLLPKERISIHFHAISCLLSVLLLSFLLKESNNNRMLSSMESFANSILEKNDPILHYKLNEVNHLIDEDRKFQKILNDSTLKKNEIIDYLREQYVLPYLEDYRKNIYLGHSSLVSDSIRIRQYRQMFALSADSNSNANIVQLPARRFGQNRYLLLKQFPQTDGQRMGDTAFLAIDVYSGTDFFKPNYLLNRNVHRLENEVHKLSCAEYVNGKLKAARDVDNTFRLNFESYPLDSLYSGMSFRYGRNQYHVYYQDPSKIVVISTPQTLLKKSMAVFPYLFILTFIQCMIISTWINFHYKKRYLLFKQRIQLLIVSMILLTAIVGCVLFSVFSQKFSQKELFQNSLGRIDMMIRMLPCEQLTADSSSTTYLSQRLLPSLYRLPNEYVENVNIYTLDGESVNLLDKNLPIPQDMERLNPQVVENIYFQNKSFYRDTEIFPLQLQANILYKPLRNERGEIVAYFSFPTRQRGGYIEQLLTSILPLLLGIYLFISLLFAIFGSLMSKYLVASLTRVANHLSQVKIRSKNQKIYWKYEDEIGCLVNDYNRLVHDLEISAEHLARSERESAWKELAQQVAHEIKNPLTPMKLSTQQLQRLLHEGRLKEEQLEKYTGMMIGQIDALTEIASSFSSLAKIHQGNGREENLREIVETAIDTFENEAECHITLACAAPDKMPVWTDKEQLLRVFNNLIKNALQAKKEDCEQKIEIKLYQEAEMQWSVSITDFGKGMNEEEKARAFSPHFTTKSNGSGLGLAIVKNILSDWGGSIRLTSVQGEFTTFYLQLPEYKP